MPQCIRYYKHRQFNAPVYLLDTGKLTPPRIFAVFVKHK